ncbi:hypothetical protein GX51_05961 [Blastomyces parvus]|uniref:Uncharacterized protein n=1 Tax=Blastomyces parvus TaxID=2060905 RepID=A0A2B7WUL6_9EURO|nr:hypothetical protein GX51_05961 [Blastomyces parvus]
MGSSLQQKLATTLEERLRYSIVCCYLALRSTYQGRDFTYKPERYNPFNIDDTTSSTSEILDDEAGIIHTGKTCLQFARRRQILARILDIKIGNLMFILGDAAMLSGLAKAEVKDPALRSRLTGHVVFTKQNKAEYSVGLLRVKDILRDFDEA